MLFIFIFLLTICNAYTANDKQGAYLLDCQQIYLYAIDIKLSKSINGRLNKIKQIIRHVLFIYHYYIVHETETTGNKKV